MFTYNKRDVKRGRVLKGKKLALYTVCLVMITAIITSGLFYTMAISNNGMALISKKDYKEYKSIKKEFGKLFELKEYVSKNFYKPVDDQDLFTGMYRGLFEGTGDKYSRYLTESEFKEMSESMGGSYEGVGLTVAPNEEGYIEVVAPMAGGPAEKQGIKSGDRVVKIDGKEYSGEEIDKAVRAMKGQAGTSVVITVFRDGKEVDFTVPREKIEIVSVTSQVIQDNIGYIRISSFNENTGAKFLEALKEMEDKNVAGLIVDLRDNPGGLVDQAVIVADALTDKGNIAYTEDRNGKKEYLKSKEGRTNLSYVVLANGGSASASEIVMAPIKDYSEGIIVGEKTYGKGIIQRVQQLKDGSAVELTIAQYFSPKGNVIHKKGITPNLEIPLDMTQFESTPLTMENDPQVQRAIQELLKK